MNDLTGGMKMSTVKKETPIKLIWMLICVGILISAFGLALLAMTNRFGRNLTNILFSCAGTALFAIGAGFCAARGCINLALPGIATVSAFIFSSSIGSSDPAPLAFIGAIFAGILLGALNGLFTLQSRRSVAAVTAVSSLLFNTLVIGIIQSVIENQVPSVRFSSESFGILAAIGGGIAIGACFLGAAGRGKLFRINEADTAVRGSERFLWSIFAGILAAFAGILQSARVGYFHVNLFSSTNALAIFPVLMMAGILIPNLCGSYAESLFGFLAILLCSLAHGFISYFFNYLGAAPSSQTFVFTLLGLLFLIPNILIFSRRRTPDGVLQAGKEVEM